MNVYWAPIHREIPGPPIMCGRNGEGRRLVAIRLPIGALILTLWRLR
jgi:hypothetical protein